MGSSSSAGSAAGVSSMTMNVAGVNTTEANAAGTSVAEVNAVQVKNGDIEAGAAEEIAADENAVKENVDEMGVQVNPAQVNVVGMNENKTNSAGEVVVEASINTNASTANTVNAAEADTTKLDAARTDAARENAADANVAKTDATRMNVMDVIKMMHARKPVLAFFENEVESDTDYDIPFIYPYAVGQTLRLNIDEENCVDAEIIKLLGPFTLSCVMVVRLDSGPLKGEFVLKLYDRRFSPRLREEEDVVPWNPRLEANYVEFVRSGCASGFFDYCTAGFREDWNWGELYSKQSMWSEPQREAYAQYRCCRIYGIEKQAYDLIRDMQGKHVPRLFACPWLQASDSPNEYHDCPGILLEYIQGYSMDDIKEKSPKEDWQYICEEAIEIVQLICLRGVLNRDVRPRSFVICQDASMKKPKLFMMDFGLCMFRHEEKNVADFRELQAHEDEEGSVGCVMEHELKGGFKYTQSSWALDLSEDFMREDYVKK